jgi:DNA-binding transcriptional ArsR family regulator
MNMANNALFATVAALSGDPARAAMLQALMDGRALTASELARVAGITPQTASGHLNRMTATGLLSVEKQGRHRYHRLAAPSVARMLESIMQVASDQPAENSQLARKTPLFVEHELATTIWPVSSAYPSPTASCGTAMSNWPAMPE